jgi:hypothetical protein
VGAIWPGSHLGAAWRLRDKSGGGEIPGPLGSKGRLTVGIRQRRPKTSLRLELDADHLRDVAGIEEVPMGR